MNPGTKMLIKNGDTKFLIFLELLEKGAKKAIQNMKSKAKDQK